MCSVPTMWRDFSRVRLGFGAGMQEFRNYLSMFRRNRVFYDELCNCGMFKRDPILWSPLLQSN